MTERIIKFRSTDSEVLPKVGDLVIAFDSEHAVMGEIRDYGEGLMVHNHWGGGEPFLEPVPLEYYEYWAEVDEV